MTDTEKIASEISLIDDEFYLLKREGCKFGNFLKKKVLELVPAITRLWLVGLVIENEKGRLIRTNNKEAIDRYIKYRTMDKQDLKRML